VTAQRDLARLFGRCLALRLDGAELAALRARLLSEPALWHALTQFALDEGLVLALEHGLRAKGLLVSELLPPGSGLVGPDEALRSLAAGLAERRQVLARHLRAIVARLNGVGIEPIVLKGGQSLLTGEPAWRHLRDIDLLIPDRADAAQRELLVMGFQVPESEAAERGRRHHLPPLVRDDFPGFIEVHRRGGNQYVRTLLPTEELAAASRPWSEDGSRCRLLPDPLHVLYALVHHHMGHAGDARGTISLKGLYEFAWSFWRMSGPDRLALQARANRHPRLSAALDAWIAAAADFYGMPVEAPFKVAADAARRWQATLDRPDRPRPWYKYPGYADEVRMALAAARIRAAPSGGRLPGRTWTRLKVMRSFLPRFTK
jgi:hypothetical protein